MHESFEEKMSAADGLIDRAASQIKSAEPDSKVVAAAAERVWKQLAGKHNARRGMKLVRGTAPVEPLFDSGRERAEVETPKTAGTRWGLWALAALLVPSHFASRTLTPVMITFMASSTCSSVGAKQVS